MADDAQRRQAHLRHEAAARDLGGLSLLTGLLTLTLGAAMLPPLLGAPGSALPLLSTILWTVLVGTLTVLGGLQLALGAQLLRKRLRVPGVAVAYAALLALFFPLGTIPAVFALVRLLAPEGRFVFTEEYAQLRARTPQLRPGISGVAVLGLLCAGFVLFVFVMAQLESSGTL